MKKLNILPAFLLMLGMLDTPVIAETSDAVQILFTSNLNARVDEDNSSGGFVNVAQTIYEEKDDDTIVLDAGNSTTGSYWETLYDSAPIYQLFTTMGYDAIATGTYDYQYGETSLQTLLKNEEEFPEIIVSNLTLSGDTQTAFSSHNGKAWTTIEKNGVKVGIFSVVDSENYSGITFADPIDTATSMVSQLESENCDAIVCLCSAEASFLEQLADKVDGLDLVLGGGEENTSVETIHDTTIACVGQNGLYVGKIILKEDGSFSSYELLDTKEEVLEESEEKEEEPEFVTNVKTKISSFQFGKDFKSKIKSSKENFSVTETESILAQGIEEAVHDYADEEGNVQVLLEQDKVLSTIPSGDVSAGTVYNLYRHENEEDEALVCFKLKGEEFYTLQEWALKTNYPVYTYHLNARYANYRLKNTKVYAVYLESDNKYWVKIDDEKFITVSCTYDFLKKISKISEETNGELSITIYNEKGKEVSSENLDSLLLKNSDDETVKLSSVVESYIRSYTGSLESTNTKASLQETKNFSVVTFFIHLTDNAKRTLEQGAGITITVLVALFIAKKIYNHMHSA